MTNKMKDYLKFIYKCVDLLEENNLHEKLGLDATPRTILSHDLVNFMSMLIGADAQVTRQEVNLLNEVFEESSIPIRPVTVKELERAIFGNLENTYSYLDKIPNSLKLFVALDLVMKSANNRLDVPGGRCSYLLLVLFYALGQEVADCDGMADIEEKLLNGYILHMMAYVKQELEEELSIDIEAGTTFIGGKK